MGKQGRRKRDLRSSWRRRRGESRESAAFRRHLLGDGAESCEGVFCRVGSVRLNGVPIPLIEPARWFDSHMQFDRAVCASGLKEFCRRPFPREDIGPVGDGVLVREIQVGIRLRAVFVSGRASA
jgi:hypothetical protein